MSAIRIPKGCELSPMMVKLV